jgi:hypothetical protein
MSAAIPAKNSPSVPRRSSSRIAAASGKDRSKSPPNAVQRRERSRTPRIKKKNASGAAAAAAADPKASPGEKVFVLGRIDCENKPRLYEIVQSIHLTRRGAIIKGIVEMTEMNIDDDCGEKLLNLFKDSKDPLERMIVQYLKNNEETAEVLHRVLSSATEIDEQSMMNCFELMSSENCPYYYDIESSMIRL